MHKLSKDRLNEIKQSKNYTIKDISEKTGIPQSTISKIFGGFNKNPTIDNLQKIAKVFDCSIDDFLIYDELPNALIHTDRIALKFSQDLQNKPILKILFDYARELADTDLELLVNLAKRLK